MPHKCTNPDCPYWENDGKTPALAYEQDKSRWERFVIGGLCLNCIDDQRKDLQMLEDCQD